MSQVTSPPSPRQGLLKRWQIGSIRLQELAPLRLAVLTLELALVLSVIQLFRIEETFGFLRLVPVIFVGFIVHALLPLRYRPACFLALSFVAIVAVFGPWHGSLLIAIGLSFVGLCHLPVAFWLRIGLIVAAAALLVALRAEWIQSSWGRLILPILASMFMFRLVVYLYDLRHEKKPASLWERLSYFFLLPNVCFPLFPVVDYQVYRRTYYDREAAAIYQKGLLWMMRGVVHLLVYRIVYYHIVPAPSEVEGLGGVVLSMVATYLLYLRISGQFHLIVGILCLFGYNLPETHHLYYLATSFTDYWRRINIYWKDFMMKLFYYPAFMRTRKWGMTTGLVVSTIVVFAGTWALHSYQWFWLRGRFPLTLTDGLFWGILGAFVVIGAVREARSGRRRTLSSTRKDWSLWRATLYSSRVVGMFVVICVLWSLWSSATVDEFVSLLKEATRSGPLEWGLLVIGLATLVGLGVGLQYVQRWRVRRQPSGSQPKFSHSAISTGAMALLLAGLALSPIQNLLGRSGGEFLATLEQDQLNRVDDELMERGYYEGLLESKGTYTSALWHVQASKPKGWIAIKKSDAVRPGIGLIDYELKPSYNGTMKTTPFRTNQWGMRDREYDVEKPNQTYRIGLLSSSYTMGAGVSGEKTFEALLERKLNAEWAGRAFDAYEVLNFAVGGYSVLHNASLVETKVFAFDPDAVFLVLHSTERNRLKRHVANLVDLERPIEGDFLKAVVERSGARPGMTNEEIKSRLEPFLDEIMRASIRRIAEACRENGVTPVMIYIPTTGEIERIDHERADQLFLFAQEAGFTMLNLEAIYGDYEADDVRLAPWDDHLGELGHKVVADRLYEVLTQHGELLGISASDENPTFQLDARD